MPEAVLRAFILLHYLSWDSRTCIWSGLKFDGRTWEDTWGVDGTWRDHNANLGIWTSKWAKLTCAKVFVVYVQELTDVKKSKPRYRLRVKTDMKVLAIKLWMDECHGSHSHSQKLFFHTITALTKIRSVQKRGRPFRTQRFLIYNRKIAGRLMNYLFVCEQRRKWDKWGSFLCTRV